MSKSKNKHPKEFLEYVKSITAKRAKVVIDHILKHGFITTEDLQDKKYGYTHAPRAARDVREKGIPLVTFKVKSKSSGRLIAAYKFGDITQIQTRKVAGRIAFSKQFKKDLYEIGHGRCFICNGEFEDRQPVQKLTIPC